VDPAKSATSVLRDNVFTEQFEKTAVSDVFKATRILARLSRLPANAEDISRKVAELNISRQAGGKKLERKNIHRFNREHPKRSA
jgi:hypothetical protein